MSGYKESDRYSGDYKHKFENLIMDTNEEGSITYLYAPFEEGVTISIGDNTHLSTIEDVTKLLGEDYGTSISFIYMELGDSESSNQHPLCAVKMEME